MSEEAATADPAAGRSILDRLGKGLDATQPVLIALRDQAHALERRSREIPARPAQPRPVLSVEYSTGEGLLPRRVRWGLLLWNRRRERSYWRALPHRATAPSHGLLKRLHLEDAGGTFELLELERRELNKRLTLVRSSLDNARKHLLAVQGRQRPRQVRRPQQRRHRNATGLKPEDIRLALKINMGHVGHAADFLGVSRRTLNRYMARHAIERAP